MKRNNLIRSLSTMVAIATAMTSIPMSVEAAKVKISESNMILSKGDKFDLDIIGAKEKKGVYKTSNKKVATVTKLGGGSSKEEW